MISINKLETPFASRFVMPVSGRRCVRAGIADVVATVVSDYADATHAKGAFPGSHAWSPPS